MYVERQATKLAEHGGQFDEDTNVALLVSAPAVRGGRITAAVQTTQVAPTILKLLGLNPQPLPAVKAEGTAVLPGFESAGGALKGLLPATLLAFPPVPAATAADG